MQLTTEKFNQLKFVRQIKNGITVETTYTPYITPVTPTATPATSEGIQGKPQEGTPTFKEGDKKVPI